MDSSYKAIAQTIYPCNWGGNWNRCNSGTCHREICSDYTINNRKQHISGVIASIVSNSYTGNIADFEKQIITLISTSRTISLPAR
jgi:hypothetical protein